VTIAENVASNIEPYLPLSFDYAKTGWTCCLEITSIDSQNFCQVLLLQIIEDLSFRQMVIFAFVLFDLN